MIWSVVAQRGFSREVAVQELEQFWVRGHTKRLFMTEGNCTQRAP